MNTPNPDDPVINYQFTGHPIIEPYTHRDELRKLHDNNIRDIARNEATPYKWRKAAVEVLLERNSSMADHPDFVLIRREISKEKESK